MDEFVSTPLSALTGILELLKATFRSRKTVNIDFRKAQLKQFWRLVDVWTQTFDSHEAVANLVW